VTDEALDLGDSTAGQRAGRHHALERLGMIFSAGLTSEPRLFLMAASHVAWWGRLTTTRYLTWGGSSQDGDLPGQSTQACAILR
jgi:hypothetical protein